ncbi:adenylate kinase [Spiroplasma endosymbiont of Virgichneumon dumeticola]|uniref:adenylate kinase n=1 Tax=Spiroplasma endosymbiont of Virgichneumon dumeticola TaxID=3139323 RepID=UPI0035C8C496
MNLIILGLPGAGKGTQSNFIVKKYGLIHLSTGDIFRNNIRNGTTLGIKTKAYMDAGIYVPDEITNNLIAARLQQSDIKTTDFILDGYPRTIDQANFLDQTLLTIKKSILVLYLAINEQTVIDRLSSRRVCLQCGRVYNLKFSPPKINNKCDIDNQTLIQRSDDKETTIKTRLEIYKKETLPLVTYYQNKGLLKTIDANLENDKVLATIEQYLLENDNG